MSKFEAKKKLLVAESEVYRELLKMEFQTFKIYTQQTKRRMTSVSSYLPMLASGLPILTSLFGGKKGKSSGFSLQRMASLVMLGWKTYQRFSGAKSPVPPPEESEAEEYLSKRI